MKQSWDNFFDGALLVLSTLLILLATAVALLPNTAHGAAQLLRGGLYSTAGAILFFAVFPVMRSVTRTLKRHRLAIKRQKRALRRMRGELTELLRSASIVLSMVCLILLLVSLRQT